MEDSLFLIKIGEIILKEGNRGEFLDALKRSIKARLEGVPNSLAMRDGRFYLTVPGDRTDDAAFMLSRLPGVNGFALATRARKGIPFVLEAAVNAARAARSRIGNPGAPGSSSFKVEARRADKSFPLDSYGIAREAGSAILEAVPDLVVDVHNPRFTVNIEIREHVYVYVDGDSGVRGLPVGTAGRGLLLLSGGIDSPVAGYLMATRGLRLAAIHFNAYPYTSREAWEKVRSLSGIVASFSGGMKLHTVPFTDLQLRLKKDAPPECTTLYLRACMVKAADLLASRTGANCLVSGESLSQVASQTAENIRFSESFTSLPVLRPLIGTDKEDTVRIARKIGTYETSILPYDDCCVLFGPKHPMLKADFARERERFASLDMDGFITAAVDAADTVRVPFDLNLRATAPR